MNVMGNIGQPGSNFLRIIQTELFTVFTGTMSLCFVQHVCMILTQTVLLDLHQGQEAAVILRFWFWWGILRSGGSIQERHAAPQPQGHPENQRSQVRDVGKMKKT